MNAFLVRVSFVSAVAIASAAAVIACSSSTTTTATDTGDSGPVVKKDGSAPDSGGTPVDGGSAGACPECADNLCQNQNPTDACSTCLKAALSQGGACVKPVGTACKADPDCVDDVLCNGVCVENPDGGGSAGDAGYDAGGDQTCFAQGKTACEQCCDTNHQKGSDTYFNALGSCICGQ